MRMHHVYLHIRFASTFFFFFFFSCIRAKGQEVGWYKLFYFSEAFPHKTYVRWRNFREIQCLKRAFSAFSRSFNTFFASTNSPGFNPRASPFSMAALHREFDSPNGYFAVSSPNSGPTNPAKSLRYQLYAIVNCISIHSALWWDMDMMGALEGCRGHATTPLCCFQHLYSLW